MSPDSLHSLVEETMQSLTARLPVGESLRLQSLTITYQDELTVSVHIQLGKTIGASGDASTWTEQNTHLNER